MLNIGGYLPTTTIDYPDKIACVIFCQGCSFNCTYCYNQSLREFNNTYEYSWKDILKDIKKKSGWLEAVVFSGGEATSQYNLSSAMEKFKNLGFLVGLHTAGAYPENFKKCLPYVDWVGFDIKATPDMYDCITQIKDSFKKVFESLDILISSGKEYQIRTTFDTDHLSEENIKGINKLLVELGAKETKIQRRIYVKE